MWWAPICSSESTEQATGSEIFADNAESGPVRIAGSVTRGNVGRCTIRGFGVD